MSAVLEVGRVEAPVLGGPVNGRATDALVRVEGAVLPHGQSALFRGGPPRPGFAGKIDHQFTALVVAQFVVVVGEVIFRSEPGALLQGDDLESSLGELVSHDAGHQAGPDRDDINLLVLCHGAVS
jgi:hypothetical protein